MSQLPGATSITGTELEHLPWKPWSTHLDPARLRRRVCGLLNKLTGSNFNCTSSQLSQLSVAAQRFGDADALDVLADRILERAILDEAHCTTYAELCQKIEDDLNREISHWEWAVNAQSSRQVHYVSSFLIGLQDCCQREFTHCSSNRNSESCLDLFALMRFIGQLVLQGIFLPADIQDMLRFLLHEAERNDENSAIAYCRFIREITKGTDVQYVLEQLGIVQDIETALHEDTIVPKIRYMLMGVLDLALHPHPIDVFDSISRRAEIYGLDSEDGSSSPGDIARISTHLHVSTEECVRSLFTTQTFSPAMEFFGGLAVEHRYIFIGRLVREAVFSNDIINARLVATFLTSVRRLCSHDSLKSGVSAEIEVLGDAVLDAPHAYRIMSIMLMACPGDLVQEILYDLLISDEGHGHNINCLRDEMASLEAELRASRSLFYPDSHGVSHEVDVHDDVSCREEDESDIAIAY